MLSVDNISYCIISISDRSKDSIKNNHNILHNLRHIKDIDFFNGNKDNGKDYIFKKYNLTFDKWSPHDERIIEDPLPGEIGVWASNLNIYEYILKNKIDYFLIIEDDVILHKDFIKKFRNAIKELPKDFDFLSLYYFDKQNELTDKSNTGLKFIHKSINQHAGFQCVLFSNNGISKIMNNLKDTDITYTIDCYIYDMAKIGLLNGYSIKPDVLKFVYLDNNLNSEIDPNNLRNND